MVAVVIGCLPVKKMSTTGLFFLITLASIASISDSVLRCVSCPCGSGNQNYTHCINESLLEDFSCERWSHCKICQANITTCISCPEDRFGPTCSEGSKEHIRKIHQNDPVPLNYRRHRRQSSSERHSEIRCLNHGPISNGRVIVILPLYRNSQPSEDDDEFDLPLGTRLKYVCYEGFHLVGKDTLECDSTGYWTESIPECTS